MDRSVSTTTTTRHVSTRLSTLVTYWLYSEHLTRLSIGQQTCVSFFATSRHNDVSDVRDDISSVITKMLHATVARYSSNFPSENVVSFMQIEHRLWNTRYASQSQSVCVSRKLHHDFTAVLEPNKKKNWHMFATRKTLFRVHCSFMETPLTIGSLDFGGVIGSQEVSKTVDGADPDCRPNAFQCICPLLHMEVFLLEDD